MQGSPALTPVLRKRRSAGRNFLELFNTNIVIVEKPPENAKIVNCGGSGVDKSHAKKRGRLEATQ